MTYAPLAVAILLLPLAASSGASSAVSFPEIVKVTSLDISAGDGFGYFVSIDGDTLLVGAPFDDDQGAASGAAYIFERNAGGTDAWGQVAKLLAPGGQSGDWFGIGVDLDGDRAVVAGFANPSDRMGFAHIFERNASGPDAWGQVAKLTADDGTFLDGYGAAVAVAGDFAVVGASGAKVAEGTGAAYVYERNAGGPGIWAQVAKLAPAGACGDLPSYCGWTDNSVGTDLSFSGEALAVGSGTVSGGSSYLFRRLPDGSWQRLARPMPADFSGGDLFGSALFLSGTTLVVGAPSDDDLGAQSGSVYVFDFDRQDRPTWTETAKLLASNGETGDRFGSSVAIDGNTIVVGATQSEAGRDWQGEAFVFRRRAGAWHQAANLIASDAEPFDVFGSAAAISGDTIAIGANGADDNAGAVYIFEATEGGPSSGRAERRGQPAVPLFGSVAAVPPIPLGRGLERAAQQPRPDSEPSPSNREVAPLGSPAPAETQYCFQFTGISLICDGLELTLSGRSVTGTWKRLIPFNGCASFDTLVSVSGRREGDHALVWCDAETNADCPVGFTWGWIIDWPFDGSMTMLQRNGGHWDSWIENLPYIVTPGPCE